MAGSRESGLKAADTNKRLYGETFYSQIGRKGGKISRGGGFAVYPELAREAGRKGAIKSAESKRAKKAAERGELYEAIPNSPLSRAVAGLERIARRFI